MSHYGSFETVRRVRDGAVLWLATCGCGQCWVTPDYQAAEKKWREHASAETGTAPMSADPDERFNEIRPSSRMQDERLQDAIDALAGQDCQAAHCPPSAYQDCQWPRCAQDIDTSLEEG